MSVGHHLLNREEGESKAIAPVFLYAAGGSQGDNGFAVGIWSFCGQLTLLAGNSAGDAGLDSYSIWLLVSYPLAKKINLFTVGGFCFLPIW